MPAKNANLGCSEAKITLEPLHSRSAAFHTFLEPSWMPQPLILLLQYLMQSSPVLAKIRQRQCLLSPKPAQHIFRSTVEVNRAIEGRRCKPFEFFRWIRLGLLQGVAKVSVSDHLKYVSKNSSRKPFSRLLRLSELH